MQRLGADAVIDYRKSEDDQLQDLKNVTGGNFFGVFDTVAKSLEWSLKTLREVSTADKKQFVTTDDWYALPFSSNNFFPLSSTDPRGTGVPHPTIIRYPFTLSPLG